MSAILVGCATEPVTLDTSKTQGHWETKVQVKDLKGQKTNSLSIDFVAVKQDRLRAEVSGSLGLSVATLVLNKDQMQMAIHTQKKYYAGKISDKALMSLMGVRLDPRVLFYVLFDEPLPAKIFDCSKDAQGMVEECKAKKFDLTVKWSERQGEMKRVTISKSDFEIQVVVKNFTTKVQESDELFKINPPAAYKSYQLD